MTAGARVAEFTGRPDDDEVAAIMAAVEALWPRVAVVDAPTTTSATSWRFSGRWWASHELTRRPRPRR